MRRFIFVFTLFCYAKSNMTVTPRNKVVLVGERVEMECAVDNNYRIFRWDVRKPAKATENIVTIDGSRSAVVNITHLGADVDNNGSGIIYYNSTEFEDAGNYTCNAITGPDKEKINYSAQLIVLESLPNCTSNYSNSSTDSGAVNLANFESITLECSWGFRGFWAPTMQWMQHNSDGSVTEKDIETQTIPNSRVTSYLTVSRDLLQKVTYFSCRTYFERKNDDTLIMNGTNIPDFVYVWNSSFFSSASSSAETTEQPHKHRVLDWLWWMTVCVVLLLLVAFLTAGSVYCIRKGYRARKHRLPRERERERLADSPGPIYENEKSPELQTYSELNESQISPVDKPPKTRPRIVTITSTTTISHTNENIMDDLLLGQDEPVFGQLDNLSETKSPIEPVSASEAIPEANDDQLINGASPSPIYHELDPNHAAANSGSPKAEVELFEVYL